MAEVKTDGGAPALRPRPLSPHLQIWRWHITMTASILHRVAGVGLYAGALILTGWAAALASGPDAYAAYMGLLGSILGKLILFGLTACIFFHMANGLRHLVWDQGKGFSPKTADFTAVAAMAFGLAAAAAVWAIALLTGAAA
jgi:succinate dehydrogenase / fumarate reductase cytochrome b subunit